MEVVSTSEAAAVGAAQQHESEDIETEKVVVCGDGGYVNKQATEPEDEAAALKNASSSTLQTTHLAPPSWDATTTSLEKPPIEENSNCSNNIPEQKEDTFTAPDVRIYEKIWPNLELTLSCHCNDYNYLTDSYNLLNKNNYFSDTC